METVLNELNQDENIIPEEIIEMPNINYDSAPIFENNSPLGNNKQNLESPFIETNFPPPEENQKKKNLEGQIAHKSFKHKNKSNANIIIHNNENHKQHVIKLTEKKKKINL